MGLGLVALKGLGSQMQAQSLIQFNYVEDITKPVKTTLKKRGLKRAL
jgi:hypothetical protein